MSEMKWTPGPWRVGEHAKLGVFAGLVGGYAIATTGAHSDNTRDPHEQYEEQAANARLIAAAPELYEALDAIVSAWNTRVSTELAIQMIGERIAPAMIALRKARGEA